MSTYWRMTKRPDTGKWEKATWMDDHFGRHRYGVLFPSDKRVFKADDYEWQTRQDKTYTQEEVEAEVLAAVERGARLERERAEQKIREKAIEASYEAMGVSDRAKAHEFICKALWD